VNIQLKQRLVGAVVLVALAVIFIPMLLPGKGDFSGGIDGSNIPPEPDYRFAPTTPAPAAPPMVASPNLPMDDKPLDKAMDKALYSKSAPVVTEKAKKTPAEKTTSAAKVTAPKTMTQKVSAAKNTTVVKPPPPSPVKEKSPQASGWVVQVGSFSNSANAKALRDKLRKQGHASFVESVKGKSGPVYRVRVGPEVSRDSAERLRQQLATAAGLKGLVQAYP
jgi:DedD protein